MKLTRQVPQRGFARGDELLRQLAPAVGERRELGEEPPVGTNQVQPGRRNHHERGRQEPVDLSLHLIVDLLDALSRLLFGFVVLDEQPRNGRTQRRLSSLERQRDLRARGVLPAVSGKRERAIDRVPELGQRVGQAIALRRGAAGRRQFGLSRERIVEIPADARKLLGPGHHRIRVVVVQHVPHREPEQMQIVLNAQQLEGILAVPIDQVALKHTKARNLAIDVDRVGHDGRQRQDQPDQEAWCGRSAGGSAARHR